MFSRIPFHGIAVNGWSLLISTTLACSFAADTRADAPLVIRGFAGEASGGFRQSWFTHLGKVPLFGARQNGSYVEWKSSPLPARIDHEQVTFVWSGALGAGPARGANFTLSVNGRPVADFDVSLNSVEFPCRAHGCRLLYQSLFAYGTSDSSGHFFLTVPAQWLKPGEPAALRVDGKDIQAHTWFALMRGEDAPLEIPDRAWRKFKAPTRQPPGTPPPAGEEATYEWYAAQYPDPAIFTPIGPPADPAETGVSPRGQLMQGKLAYSDGDGTIAGTLLVTNAMAFGLLESGRFLPVGSGEAAEQSLLDGRLPIVVTDWTHDSLSVRETAFARPLRGDTYTNGLEATLAWAVFDLTWSGKQPREIAFAATLVGMDSRPRRTVGFRDNALFENDSAIASVHPPAAFAVEFQPVLGHQSSVETEAGAVEFLRQGGAYNALIVRGQLEPGQTKRLAFCQVFQFPGMLHWGPRFVKVAAEELTGRSAGLDFAKARSGWDSLATKLNCFETPDLMLNRIVTKAMLDGCFLTKRWDGRHIVFDSVCYRCQWDDASAKWFYALDLMGDHATSAKLLDTLFARQGQRKPAGAQSSEGCFSDVANIRRDGSDAAWASCNGWALWAMAQHARPANDRAWLTAHKPQILAGADWILRERQLSKQQADNPCAGLIHGKFVCDMPDNGPVKGVGYFTYTDAISYLGLHDMAGLLTDWGHEEGRPLQTEAEQYRRDIIAAVDRAIDRSRDPWFVPWALHAPRAERKYLSGVCGPINLAYAGVLPRDDERIRHVIRWNVDHDNGGGLEQSAIANMFYSQDLAITLLEQDRVEDFLRIFYCILGANVTHETLATCEWRRNTQPHVHSIASLVRMFRTMLVQERDGGVVLLQGTPRRWLAPGKEIHLRSAPTWYGPLSLHARSTPSGKSIAVQLELPPRIGATPVRLRLRQPPGQKIDRATCRDKAVPVQGEWLDVTGLTGPVEIRAQVAPSH
jgi:hypothetical protein